MAQHRAVTHCSSHGGRHWCWAGACRPSSSMRRKQLPPPWNCTARGSGSTSRPTRPSEGQAPHYQLLRCLANGSRCVQRAGPGRAGPGRAGPGRAGPGSTLRSWGAELGRPGRGSRRLPGGRSRSCPCCAAVSTHSVWLRWPQVWTHRAQQAHAGRPLLGERHPSAAGAVVSTGHGGGRRGPAAGAAREGSSRLAADAGPHTTIMLHRS